jgi:anti-sigma regulatory factor (Ser/Thr protein kinase)
MGWLLDQGFPRARVEDLVLAVDEAVSNAVEHAYRDAESPGDVEVRCGFAGDGDGPRWAAVSVIDHGVWRPIPPNRGFRGRGLQMITNLTDWRTIERSAEGTTVTMISFAG